MKTLSYYCRAFKQISKYEPLLIPLTVLLALSSGIKPFVNIYLSAEIIAELTYNKDIPGLVTLVIASVVINMILQILSESLQPAYSNLRSRLYIKERIEIERKLFTIDYASLESSEFQELIHLHRESSEKVYSAFMGFRLPRKEGKQEDNKDEVSFHGTHLTFSSLTVSARTRSSFSTSND